MPLIGARAMHKFSVPYYCIYFSIFFYKALYTNTTTDIFCILQSIIFLHFLQLWKIIQIPMPYALVIISSAPDIIIVYNIFHLLIC